MLVHDVKHYAANSQGRELMRRVLGYAPEENYLLEITDAIIDRKWTRKFEDLDVKTLRGYGLRRLRRELLPKFDS